MSDQMPAGERRRYDDVYEAVRFVVASEQGRAFLRHMLTECGVFAPSFDGETSAEQLLVNEGRRQIGLQLISWMNVVDPAMFMSAERERIEREKVYTALNSVDEEPELSLEGNSDE